MELVSDSVHRSLVYVAALNREGYAPTWEQVEAFATSPGPRAAVYENVAASFNKVMLRLSSMQQLVTAAEPVVEYLIRMEWVDGDGSGGLRVTRCGDAFLRALGRVEAQDNESVEVTLDPSDPLVYVQLTRLVAAAGAALLVDAYFKPDFVPWLVEATQVQRLLVSSRHGQAKSDLAAMGLALGATTHGRAVEVRSTSDKRLHDRCLISPAGSVSVLGTSLNGVGQSLTALVPLGPEASRAYSDLYEELWREGTAVEALTITTMTAPMAAEEHQSADSHVVAAESEQSES